MNHVFMLTQLCWSYNIYKEHDASNQILLGATHLLFCVVLGFPTLLEYHIAAGENVSTNFLFGIEGLNDAKTINAKVQTLMNNIINAESLNQIVEEIKKLKGLHSIQKITATCAKKYGCPKDEIDPKHII